jgi:hypothetical protein
MRFAGAHPIMQRERHAERRDDEESDPPAKQAVKRASEQRRKTRRSRHCDHGQCESPRERRAIEQVTGYRTRQDRGGASPKRLDDAVEDQERQGVGEGAKDAAGDKDCKTAQHQPSAAEAIRERSDEKLPEGEGKEEAAQRQSEFLGRSAEGSAKLWKGGQDDVGRQCAERSEPGEQEQDAPRQRALGRHGVRDRRGRHHDLRPTTRHVDEP